VAAEVEPVNPIVATTPTSAGSSNGLSIRCFPCVLIKNIRRACCAAPPVSHSSRGAYHDLHAQDSKLLPCNQIRVIGSEVARPDPYALDGP
jgi:hypothetical protein